MTTITLSENASKVLVALKLRGPMWEQNIVDVLFPTPKYTKETAAAFWQWCVNLNGRSECQRPVNGELVFFETNVSQSYMDVLRDALNELTAAGLIGNHNNGANEFSYFAK